MSTLRMYDRCTPMPALPTYAGKFEEYQEALQKASREIIEPFQHRMGPESLTGLLKDALNGVVNNLIARDRMLMVAPGLRLARVDTNFIAYEPPADRRERIELERQGLDRDRIDTALILEFYPGPIWGFDQAGSHGGIPLGHFHAGHDKPEAYRRSYDLYFQPQFGLPPTLVARYGEAGPDYHSLNPSLAQISLEGETHEPFRAAYQRAVKFGLMEQQPLQYSIELLGSGNWS